MKEARELLAAQEMAEKRGEHEFVCPRCGGMAQWSRSQYNGHLFVECDGCGIAIME